MQKCDDLNYDYGSRSGDSSSSSGLSGNISEQELNEMPFENNGGGGLELGAGGEGFGNRHREGVQTTSAEKRSSNLFQY